MKGRLYGLGVGPGDPELLTLKALRVLRSAAVVAYPATEEGASFARAVVAEWLSPRQREVALRFPMRPEAPPEAAYDKAAAALAAELEAGYDVACLCQGDPLFYGTFGHLLSRLAGRYPVEVVPGVSSLGAASAAAAAPLACREETLVVVPATIGEAALESRLLGVEAAAVVKLGRHLEKLRRVLSRLSLLDRALYVERASLSQQRVIPFNALDAREAPYFSMALLPPPSRIVSSSLCTCDITSARKRMLASKRAEVGSIFVSSTFAGADEFIVEDSLRSAMGQKSRLITVYHAGIGAQRDLAVTSSL
jgi:precorrin-2/cobalt-factor-2 C20-methyltransferase